MTIDDPFLAAKRLVEAYLFASPEPVGPEAFVGGLPEGVDVDRVLSDLARDYENRGVRLVEVAGGWAFRTAPDLAAALADVRVEQRRLSRAALETLAIVAYHQPVTRADIEEIRGVSVSRGTLDQLLELEWIMMGARRLAPGKPVTYRTTAKFLDHFGLTGLSDLPGVEDMRAAGLLDAREAAGLDVPRPGGEHDLIDAEEGEREFVQDFMDADADDDDATATERDA